MCWGHKEGEEGRGDNAQSSEIQPGLLCVGVEWVSWLVLGAGGAFLGMEELCLCVSGFGEAEMEIFK